MQTARWAKASSKGNPGDEEVPIGGGGRPSLRVSCDGSWASAMDTTRAPSSTGSFYSPPTKVLGPTFAKPIRVQY